MLQEARDPKFSALSSQESLERLRAELFSPYVEDKGSMVDGKPLSFRTASDVCNSLETLVSLKSRVLGEGGERPEVPEIDNLVDDFRKGLETIAMDFRGREKGPFLSATQRILFAQSVEEFTNRLLSAQAGDAGELRDALSERLLTLYSFLETCDSGAVIRLIKEFSR
jgi:hypothetical protein